MFREHKAAKEHLARIESEIARAKTQIQSFLTADLNNLQTAQLPECLAGAQLGKLLDDYKSVRSEMLRLEGELRNF